MKISINTKIFSTLLLFCLVFGLTAQNLIKINDTTSHFLSGSFLLNDDTLELKYNAELNHQQFTGSEDFYSTYIIRSNGLNNTSNSLIDTNFLSNTMHKLSIGNGQFVEIGNKLPNGNLKRGSLWIKNDLLQKGVIVKEPFKDSVNTGVYITETFQLNNTLFVFGSYHFKNYPFEKTFLLKYDLYTNQIVHNNYHCYASFCYITRLKYDKVNNNFIAISTARLGDTIAPNGAGIAKIDTNLNLLPNTSHAMAVNYAYYSWDTGHYRYSADIAWVTDSTFLAAGTVINPDQFPSQTPNPNPAYHDDIAVALRSSDSLREIHKPKVYGKVDTAESQGPGDFILEKMDSNLFVAVTNSRYYNPQPEPWKTSLALFGLDANGDKHWEYYMPYKDYCWAKQVHPTSKGGLWLTAQCSGGLDIQAGTYEYFVKIAYIDSIAHWPRKGTVVGVKEPSKKASDFVVFPNPTTDYLRIQQYGLITSLNYQLYDQSGRLLRSQRSAEHQVEMNIQDLANGFYILRILSESGELIATEKIVKQ